MLIDKFQLKEWCGIFGIRYYASIMATRMAQKGTEVKSDVSWVYNFKKYGRNSEQAELAVRTVCEHFECSDIIAVPSSTAGETNNLQQLFGTKIVRSENVEKRKWTHSREIPWEYSNSYNINTNEIKGTRILLVDDVCTTGKTITHYKMALESLDFQVIPLALGLNEKLKDIKLLEWFYLYREEDKGMFSDIPDLSALYVD